MITLTLLEAQSKTPLENWRFDESTAIRVGRAADNDIVLDNNLVSRYHLELRNTNSKRKVDSWEIVSKGTNGTFVNGILVTHAPLRDNCFLQLARGGPILKLEFLKVELHSIAPTSAQIPAPDPESCTHEGNSPDNLFCIYCGKPLSIQLTIRHYQVLRTLGQGGMGTTYLAWDSGGITTSRPKLLVLKQMNADMAKIAKARELFQREADTLGLLNHPGIPKYYDFFIEDKKKYLAMELIHGQDLEKFVYRKGPVTVNQAIEWMMQTCEILDYLHGQNPPLIHRDIKPANLMVRNSNNRIVVLDFGAVKEIGTAPGTRIGAEGYCAPEQERGQPLTQSDLYAIGPTLIFLLTGENPFKFYRQQGRNFRFDVTKVPTVTPELKELIDKVTEPLPRDRYQTAKEVATALAGCLLSV